MESTDLTEAEKNELKQKLKREQEEQRKQDEITQAAVAAADKYELLNLQLSQALSLANKITTDLPNAGKDLALQTLRAELERSNRQKRDAVERANELEDLLEKVHRGMVEKVQPAIDEQVEILSTELAMMRKRSILSSSEGQTDVQNIAQGRPQKQVKKPHRGSKEYVSRNSLLV
eukprot:TRINITY_DN1274_c7_g1_i4.p1 TRINITY_DN1274_c7_g1~~TRINITY_DN1274_c7_g1_i4.p1  ORF type:complete len:183 (-),score=74.56 TRINITY_DN1274_c7_g1_i4:57-581(-)